MSLNNSSDGLQATRSVSRARQVVDARNGACAARPAHATERAELTESVIVGTPEAAPLVYRKQSLGTSPSEERKRRYRRRFQSSKWLISDAHEDIESVDTETGEIITDWTKAPRLSKCSWRMGSFVPVHAANGKAHYSGTERCSSIWSCPVCASVVRAQRAREIQQAVEAHSAAGGAALFVTLTIRHKKIDPLADSLDAVLKSWQNILRSTAWVGGKRQSGMRERFGVIGYIRSTEVTYGVNGWHPHIHAIILLDKDLSQEEVLRFGDELHGHWSKYVHKRTGRMPTRKRGTDVQKVDKDGKVLGQYMAKMQDEGKQKTEKWGVSAELARTDIKSGRGGSFVPFELLDREHPFKPGHRHHLWTEYTTATKGRRAITWSRGLKDLYAVDELTDEEIIEETESAPARWLAYAKGYDALMRKDVSLLAHVLDLAELEAWEDVARLLPGEPAPDFQLIEDDPPEESRTP